MSTQHPSSCTAFRNSNLIASGQLPDVATAAKPFVDAGETVLIFDDLTSEQIEIDFRGSPDDVKNRLATPSQPPRGPGRPKLGVIPREVTLLPRHGDWLSQQPGGASVALRKLVEEARRANHDKDRIRQAQEQSERDQKLAKANEALKSSGFMNKAAEAAKA